MKHISVSAFQEVLETEQSNSTVDFINVCTPAEYQEKHIKGVRNVPLDELEKHLEEFTEKKTIFVHCRSGKRGARAIEALEKLGVQAELVNVEGGLLAWEEIGFETGSLAGNRIPIIRQTMIAAGSLIILAHILAWTIGSEALFISFFVGVGLLFAGITGHCGMALVLARMPWNTRAGKN